MYSQPLHLLDSSIYTYLVVHSKTFEILDGNLLAKSFFYGEDGYPLLNEIFTNTLEEDSFQDVIQNVTQEGSDFLYDYEATQVNGTTFRCNIEVCNVDRENSLLFLVIREKSQKKEVQIRELVELSHNPVFVLNCDYALTMTYGNARCFQSMRMDEEEFRKKFQSSFLNLLEKEKRASFLETIRQQLETDGECDADIELLFDNEVYQLFRFNAYYSKVNSKLYGVLISVKKQSDLMKKIEYDQQFFDIMQEFSKDLLFRIDVKKRTLVHRGDISKFHGLLPEVTNYPESMREIGLIHPDDLEGYVAFAYKLMYGMVATFQPRIQFTNGVYEKYKLQGKPLFDNDGNTVQVVGKFENIQKYVDIEKKANYDALTTTLNKQSFRELITNLFERAVEKDRFALLFLDFDDFKGINDNMGHVFGDFLLEVAGKRILNCVRNQDRVGRVGGDEFVIFFQHAANKEAVLDRAEEILHSLRREFNNGDLSCTIKASIGISIFPEHGTDYETLYGKADKALYKSKELGKDVATLYSEDLELLPEHSNQKISES